MKRYRLLFALILVVGCAVRLVGIDQTPAGVNADEAYAGYEAWSMAKDGTDSHGYANPVYFVSWGSGMNVLYSYLSMPAVKIFGLNVFSIRITQAVFGCLTLILIYLTLRRFVDKRKSLIIFGLFAICPWHIMLSRWGLESDILPFFMALGVFGFVYGLQRKPFLLLSALGFGLCLYSYAVAWVATPILLGLLVFYSVRTKRLSLDKWSVLSALLLVLIGLPLALFLLVNAGILPEIRTAFISIPKMPVFGSGGYNLEVPKHIMDFVNVLFNFKIDGYNAISGVGLFFLFSSPFVVYGFWRVGKKALRDFRAKNWSLEVVLAFWFAAYIPVILFINDKTSMSVNPTRINAVFLPIFIAMVLGILHLAGEVLSRRVLPVILAMYLVGFLGFLQVYPENRAWNFSTLPEAIEWTNDVSGEVYFDGIDRYSEVLFAAKPTIDARTAIQENPNITERESWMKVWEIGRYKLFTDVSDALDFEGTYVINAGNGEFNDKLADAGFGVVFENADRKVWRKSE